MTQKAPPFVFEQATVTGTATVSLTGAAAAGFFTFNSQFSVGDTTTYFIVDTITYAYETGFGTFAAGNTLQRTTPQASVTGTLPYSFAGNLCNIFVGNAGPIVVSLGSQSAGRTLMLNANGQLDSSIFGSYSFPNINVLTSGTAIAAGTTQGTATALSNIVNVITTVATGAGVILPVTPTGGYIKILNRGANVLTVYPPTGQTIETLVVNNPTGIDLNSYSTFHYAGANQWYQA